MNKKHLIPLILLTTSKSALSAVLITIAPANSGSVYTITGTVSGGTDFVSNGNRFVGYPGGGSRVILVNAPTFSARTWILNAPYTANSSVSRIRAGSEGVTITDNSDTPIRGIVIGESSTPQFISLYVPESPLGLPLGDLLSTQIFMPNDPYDYTAGNYESTDGELTIEVSPIPEPSSILLGLMSLPLLVMRKRQN